MPELSTKNPLRLTKTDIRKIGEYVKSDGCSYVRDIFKPACIVHDYYYSEHKDLSGHVISRQQADDLFLLHMLHISKSKLQIGLAYMFYGVVRLLGWIRY